MVFRVNTDAGIGHLNFSSRPQVIDSAGATLDGDGTSIGGIFDSIANEIFKGLDLKVSKKGYKVWRKRVKVTPGQIVDVSLSRKQRIATLPKVQKAKPVAAPKKTPVAEAKPVARRTGGKATVSVAALTEVYGVSKPVSDVAINIDGRRVGKTNASGTYTYRGKPGETIELKLTAPGHIPSEWKTSINLLGKHTIRQFFNPAKYLKLG